MTRLTALPDPPNYLKVSDACAEWHRAGQEILSKLGYFDEIWLTPLANYAAMFGILTAHKRKGLVRFDQKLFLKVLRDYQTDFGLEPRDP